MPKNKAPNFIQKLRAIRLSDDRRASMRADLAAYADMHAVTKPVRAAQPQLSPYFARMLYSVTAFALVIMVTGSGAAYASGKALPGDLLYPVKVSIAEPVKAALARTPEAKAELHVELAERRLEEATQLAAKNKLDAKKQELLAVQVEKHVVASDALAQKLETSGKAEVSLAVRSDLEARLTAHSEILGMIGDHLVASSTAEETGRNAKVLALSVRARKDAIANIRQSRELATASATTSVQTVIAAAKKTDQAIATMSASATGLAPAAVEDHVDAAQTALTNVKDQIASDQPKAAARQAQEAARASEVAAIIMRHESLLKALGIISTSTATTTKPAATTTPAVQATTTSSTNASGTTSAPRIRFFDGVLPQ